eukprot:TRINITY_DN291_c0_g3_i1.p1 TRINITY_DN291_c0_g3~~TRINITY_DN291_c0_g3_i1.p1  ORF type:complete len:557 (+),score=140.65 TRINITY_DN291_c0_g3_i1:110-1780(+)
MCSFIFAVSLLGFVASGSDVPGSPSKGTAMMQTRLRGARTEKQSVQSPEPDLNAVEPASTPMEAKQLITGQRYSDDDESCSFQGITPGVCALASLARAPAPSPKSLFSFKAADCDKQESADRLERALIAEIESALAGNHTGFGPARLQVLEQELQPIFATLPHESSVGSSEGGLGYAAARYLLHQHFLRQHSWYVRGLNPAGDGRKPPGDKEALRSRVAGHLLEVMEKKAGSRGLDLKMLAIFVATLEHLLHGDEHERLKQSWAVHGFQPDGVTDEPGLVRVLEVFMAHYVFISFKADSGYALTLEEGRKEVEAISGSYSGWPQIRSSIEDQVQKQMQVSGPQLTFKDADLAVDEVLLRFREVSGSMCHDMEKSFQKLVGGERGRVNLQELRNADGGDLFRESLDYLKELEAVDGSESEPQILMANYMLGPSNCDGTTSFYDLCCPNTCESHKEQLELALLTAGDHVSAITKVAQQRLATELPADMLKALEALSQEQGGKVLIHGRAFADWLHKVFPRDCPRPREKDFKGMAGDVLPDANTDFQGKAIVENDLMNW